MSRKMNQVKEMMHYNVVERMQTRKIGGNIPLAHHIEILYKNVPQRIHINLTEDGTIAIRSEYGQLNIVPVANNACEIGFEWWRS